MCKVLRLDILSVARLFAIFYAVVGLYVSVKTFLTDAEKLVCPLGLDYPYLYFHVNFNLVVREWPSSATPLLLLISVACYAITGSASGAAAAIVYNLTSRFWPIYGRI